MVGAKVFVGVKVGGAPVEVAVDKGDNAAAVSAACVKTAIAVSATAVELASDASSLPGRLQEVIRIALRMKMVSNNFLDVCIVFSSRLR